MYIDIDSIVYGHITKPIVAHNKHTTITQEHNMNETRYEYNDRNSDDRQINLDNIIDEIHSKLAEYEAIEDTKGYEFNGVQYD